MGEFASRVRNFLMLLLTFASQAISAKSFTGVTKVRNQVSDNSEFTDYCHVKKRKCTQFN